MLEVKVGPERYRLSSGSLVVAGYTGRNVAAVQAHVEELKEQGVPAPDSIPWYGRLSWNLLTQESRIEVASRTTSGEVEPVLIALPEGRHWLTVGSDHTDRGLEQLSIAKSKQVCPHVLAREAWPLPLHPDQESLRLRSWVRNHDEEPWQLYQEGTVALLRPFAEILASVSHHYGELPWPLVLFCGTIPTKGGELQCTAQFRGSLTDERTGEEVTFEYTVETLNDIA